MDAQVLMDALASLNLADQDIIRDGEIASIMADVANRLQQTNGGGHSSPDDPIAASRPSSFPRRSPPSDDNAQRQRRQVEGARPPPATKASAGEASTPHEGSRTPPSSGRGRDLSSPLEHMEMNLAYPAAQQTSATSQQLQQEAPHSVLPTHHRQREDDPFHRHVDILMPRTSRMSYRDAPEHTQQHVHVDPYSHAPLQQQQQHTPPRYSSRQQQQHYDHTYQYPPSGPRCGYASRVGVIRSPEHIYPRAQAQRRRKIDVVSRGQQMRSTWDHDPFLSQRGRKSLMWEVRCQLLQNQ